MIVTDLAPGSVTRRSKGASLLSDAIVSVTIEIVSGKTIAVVEMSYLVATRILRRI